MPARRGYSPRQQQAIFQVLKGLLSRYMQQQMSGVLTSRVPPPAMGIPERPPFPIQNPGFPGRFPPPTIGIPERPQPPFLGGESGGVIGIPPMPIPGLKGRGDSGRVGGKIVPPGERVY